MKILNRNRNTQVLKFSIRYMNIIPQYGNSLNNDFRRKINDTFVNINI